MPCDSSDTHTRGPMVPAAGRPWAARYLRAAVASVAPYTPSTLPVYIFWPVSRHWAALTRAPVWPVLRE